MIFSSDKKYNTLKWFAIMVLPAFVTLVGSLADIWGFPYGPQIVATVGAVQLFLAGIVQKSSHDYKIKNSDKDA